MSGTVLLSVAVFVFAMMSIGLGLTIWEFRTGQPRREKEVAQQPSSTPEPKNLTDAP